MSPTGTATRKTDCFNETFHCLPSNINQNTWQNYVYFLFSTIFLIMCIIGQTYQWDHCQSGCDQSDHRESWAQAIKPCGHNWGRWHHGRWCLSHGWTFLSEDFLPPATEASIIVRVSFPLAQVLVFFKIKLEAFCVYFYFSMTANQTTNFMNEIIFTFMENLRLKDSSENGKGIIYQVSAYWNVVCFI